MDFNEDQLLTLLQLKPDLPLRFNTTPISKEPEQVPDILDEFAYVADTKVFKEPFSLKKYKNLIPKKSPKKKPRKRKSTTDKLLKDKKLVFEYSTTPSSPCLSVDSAIDLSADLNSNFSLNTISNCSLLSSTWVSNTNFEFDRASICGSDFTDNSSVFSLETPSHCWHTPKDNSKPIMKENRNQYLKELEDTIYIKPKKIKHTPCSLSDILLTDISYQIPIIIENISPKVSESCNDILFDKFLGKSNTFCSIESTNGEIKDGKHFNGSLDSFTTEKTENPSITINKQEYVTNVEKEIISENKIVHNSIAEYVSNTNDGQETILNFEEGNSSESNIVQNSAIEDISSTNEIQEMVINIEEGISNENSVVQNSTVKDVFSTIDKQETIINIEEEINLEKEIVQNSSDASRTNYKQETNVKEEISSEKKIVQNRQSEEVPEKVLTQQYTAIKSSRFIVEDGCEIPSGLLELLDIESSCSSSKLDVSTKEKQNTDNNNNNNNKSLKKTKNQGTNQQIRKPSNNFCVGLLHMMSSGILEKNQKWLSLKSCPNQTS